MRLTRYIIFWLVLLVPAAFGLMQSAPRLEITGVNPSQLPTVVINANVYDTVNQPITNLTAANFALIGELAPFGQIISVENISDQNLPIATVLAIDISTSMEGRPYFEAQAAARAFVENIGANDPVAIVTFGSGVNVLQPYTTDKAVLLSVIDNLPLGGETALYQGAYEAVRLAAESPVPRRAVILLSDGAEYGGQSTVGRGAALEEAITRGVPVYAIGLGYGADRSYLLELSSGTNGRLYESPAPEQLTGIYTELATILRSQYVITANINVPADGTTYTLGLQVNTDAGSSTADAALRTPIPVPVIELTLPTEPISAPTDITAAIRADDAIEGVNFSVAGTEQGAMLNAEPYTFTINPLDYVPGTYTLAVSALDATGDVGTATGEIIIAPLPPTLAFNPDPAALGTIMEAQTITIEAGGQTPASDFSVQFDADPAAPLDGTTFVIDPAQFTPGDHTVTISATNESGIFSSLTGTFTVGAIAPAITLTGLEAGQVIEFPVTFGVETAGQVPVQTVTVFVDGFPLPANDDGTYTLDPVRFAPGEHTVQVGVQLQNGVNGSLNVPVTVANVPPRILVTGLTPGETLEESRTVEITAEGQSVIAHLAVLIDGVDVGHFTAVPVEVTLDVLALGAGDHVMRLIADDATGQSAQLDVPFAVSSAPIATATQIANATATSVQATQFIEATAAIVQATRDTQATAVVLEATSNAVATSNAQATLVIEMTTTQDAAITATEQAQATATQIALFEQTQQRAAEQTSTQAAFDQQGTSVARSTLDAGATQFALATSTQIAVVTRGAAATGTAESVGATATQAANEALAETAAAISTATEAANQTATEQANATATQDQILGATATEVANQTATEQANVSATAAANASATAEGTVAARATAVAALNVTSQGATRSALETRAAQTRLEVQATQDARATRDANETAVIGTTTAIAQDLQTRDAQFVQTATAAALTQGAQTVTEVARQVTATAQAQQTLDAGATATAAAIQTDTAQEALVVQNETATAVVTEMTATAAQATLVQQTQDARSTQSAVETLAVLQTQVAQGTQGANATATQIAGSTATESAAETQAAQTATEAARQVGATETSAGAATQRANILATDAAATATSAQATSQMQATVETRLTAIGPTMTPIEGTVQVVQAPTDTPTPPREPPTITPTLVPVEAEGTPITSSIIPILIIVFVVLILLVVAFLIIRRRA
ncbi:MAG: VWA domain-containing protein [Anaerolinea sp.]|nr:VWA domain-containing protein [Anaerolinea sp.]